MEEQNLETNAPVLKRRRIVKFSKEESAKGQENIAPPMVEVESSGEKAKVYTRRSMIPSPKDGVPKANLPPIVSQEKKKDDVPSTCETQIEPGEVENVEEHPDTEGEEFHEGELYSVEAEVDKVMQSPLVAYAKSLVTNEEVTSPPREEEAEKIPSPKHQEGHIGEERNKDETPKK